MSVAQVQINEFARLPFRDPTPVLRDLRKLEEGLETVSIDPRLRRLRTGGLKPEREARDAALFSHGMAQVLGTKVFVAPVEADDYDFVTMWVADDTQHFCPVQLKELVPDDLNSQATLRTLLEGLSRYAPSLNTALAVRLNRAGHIEFADLELPRIPFSQLWFFGCASADSARWFLYGDALADPKLVRFDYPT